MFCPQCGGANEETARFCNSCGLDLVEYKEKWGNSVDQTAAPAQQAYQPPAGQGSTYQQPYQQTYQQPYQPPYQPYQQQYPSGYQPPLRAGGYGAVPNIPTYMGWAIAVLILCFWPTGIAAVVYASQVNNRLALGDVAGAKESSRKAKMWCWITFGIGIAAFVIAVLVAVFASTVSLNVY
ncbi:MAG: CD225/dispanin family protein [Thermoleophilia bacterium]|nr:CD225/dispanin family protein [Thermoleophilia bacterium]